MQVVSEASSPTTSLLWSPINSILDQLVKQLSTTGQPNSQRSRTPQHQIPTDTTTTHSQPTPTTLSLSLLQQVLAQRMSSLMEGTSRSIVT